jgi:hypothetical protein
MADDIRSTSNDGAAVADPPGRDERAIAAIAEAPASLDEKKTKKRKKDEDDDIEYEVEFATPFGKIEFEFEPLSKKQKKDQQRKARAEREAQKAAAKMAKLAEKGVQSKPGGGRGNGLLIALVIFGIIAATIALAVWLFARPSEEEDAIPAEFRAEDAPTPEPQGFVAKMRGRAREAVTAGRRASREAQNEQQKKFEEMTGR